MKWESIYDEGPFAFGGNVELGVNRSGFYIKQNNQIVFKSTSFEQVLHEPDKTERCEGGAIGFRDLNTGSSFTCTMGVPGKEIPWPDGQMEDEKGRVRFQYPSRLHFEYRRIKPAELKEIIDALRVLCNAAIETGNPIRWC